MLIFVQDVKREDTDVLIKHLRRHGNSELFAEQMLN
jgi:hypothetical protein